MKLNLNTGLSALPKIGAGTGPAPFPNTYSTDFDGADDYIDCGDITAFNGATEMSCFAWVKINTLAADKGIMAKWDYATQGCFALQTIGADELRLYVAPYITDTGHKYVDTTDANLVADTWYHIGFVYDGSLANANIVKIYVDGVAKTTTATASLPTSLTTATSSFKIGKFGGALPRNIDANIDEVSVFDEALAASKVTEYYNSGAPTNLASESGLVAWYRQGDSAVFNADSQWEFPEQTKINNWSSHSFEFDGVNDYIDCGTGLNSSLELADSFSFSAWIKFDTSGDQTIISNFSAPANLLGFQLRVTSADRVRLILATTYTNYRGRDSSVLSTGTWYHVAATYDGSNTLAGINMYIDGSLDNAATVTAGTITTITTTESVKIGKDAGGSYFEGMIDSVSIWNAELTSGNVTSIFASGVPNDVSDLGISGLQGYWRMGEGADWNNTNWQVPDYSKNALFSQQSFELDGVDQYVNTGNVISSAGAFSISAWFYASANDDRTIVSMDNRNTTQRLFQIQIQTGSGGYVSGNLIAYIWDNSASAYLGRQTDLAITLNTWHHILLSYDGSDVQAGLKLYIDNSEKTRTYSGGSFTSDDAVTADLLIGAYTNSGGSKDRFFEGNVDSVSVWDEALTAGNVTSIYNSSEPNDISGLGISGLVGWWKMGEGSSFAGGNWTIPDASTNSNDGTSANMNEVDKKYISPGNENSGESSGMNEIDNINNAPDNENQGLSVGMVSGSVVEETP